MPVNFRYVLPAFPVLTVYVRFCVALPRCVYAHFAVCLRCGRLPHALLRIVCHDRLPLPAALFTFVVYARRLRRGVYAFAALRTRAAPYLVCRTGIRMPPRCCRSPPLRARAERLRALRLHPAFAHLPNVTALRTTRFWDAPLRALPLRITCRSVRMVFAFCAARCAYAVVCIYHFRCAQVHARYSGVLRCVTTLRCGCVALLEIYRYAGLPHHVALRLRTAALRCAFARYRCRCCVACLCLRTVGTLLPFVCRTTFRGTRDVAVPRLPLFCLGALLYRARGRNLLRCLRLRGVCLPIQFVALFAVRVTTFARTLRCTRCACCEHLPFAIRAGVTCRCPDQVPYAPRTRVRAMIRCVVALPLLRIGAGAYAQIVTVPLRTMPHHALRASLRLPLGAALRCIPLSPRGAAVSRCRWYVALQSVR